MSQYPPSSTFCILPWVHAATMTSGDIQLCCVAEGNSGLNLNRDTLGSYWNSEYTKGVRRDMLAGNEVSACRRCFEEERNGYRSHRMAENGVWKRRLGDQGVTTLLDQTDAHGHLDAGIQSVDLRLGNTCNLQCIMCRPHDSSMWLNPAKKLAQMLEDPAARGEWEWKANIDTKLFEWYRRPEFWENLKTFLPHVKEIIVAGGEPMLIKEHFAFIRACVESGHASHIHLRYHTNGTIYPEDMAPLWETFQRVEFFVSLDGVGPIANYVRYPSDWEKVEANIRRFDALGPNTILKLLFSAHATNIAYMGGFLHWVATSGLKKLAQFDYLQQMAHPSLVHWPQNQNPKVLPAALKAEITRGWGEYRDELRRDIRQRPDEPLDKFDAIIAFMNSEDWSDKFPSLVQYTRALDQIRGTDFDTTFPKLAAHWTT